MYLKKSFILLLVIIISTVDLCFAQLSQVVSAGDVYSAPSPNASALLRYANVPVDEHTGIASVVLPIDQLAGRQLSVPITLSYHGAGNKVQDIASNVGLGFVLNAGGVITRMMRGLPDESPTGYQYNGKRIYSGNIDSVYLNATINSKIDGEPDMFYFNFLGHSGKMVVDTLGNAQYLPDQGIRVISHPIHNNPDSTNNAWVLKDFSGTTYVFGSTASSKELSVVNSAGQPVSKAITYTSSWYLAKIISPDGKETMTFNYNAGPDLSYKQYRNITTYVVHYDCTDKRKGLFSSKVIHSETHSIRNRVDIDVSTIIQVLSPKYLSSIQNDMGSVTFSYNTRQDLSGGQALNKISIYNIYDSATPLKTYTFNESYFLSAKPNSPTDPDSKRLRLDCVSLQGRGAETKQLFVFGYNEQTQLPPRNSDEFDHWGYYTTLNTPAGYPSANLTTDKYGNYDDGFDRRVPDSVRTKAWILTKIRNLNGGYTNFDYSINDYKYDGGASIGGGLRIKTIVANDSLGQVTPIVKQYSYAQEDGTSSGMVYNPKPYYIQGITNYQAGTVVKPIPSLLSYELNNFKNPFTLLSIAASVAFAANPVVGLVVNVAITIIVPAVISAWNFIFHRTHHYQYDSPPFSISSTPLNNLFDVNGASVTYSRVSVTNGDGGKTVNYYTSQQEYPDSTSSGQLNCLAQPVKIIYGNTGSYPPNTSFASERGLLKKSMAYDNNNNLVSTVTNIFQLSKRVSVVKGQRASVSGYATLANGGFQVITYNLGLYKEVSENIQLVNSITQLYDQTNNGNVLTTTHAYTWQPVYPTLLRSESIPRSDGKLLVNYITYPMEYTPGTTFLDNMVSHNIVASPIETVSTLQDASGVSIIGGVSYRYKNGGLGLLDTAFSLSASKPIPQANFKFSNQAKGAMNGNYGNYSIDKSYIAKAFYQVYDSKNNIIQTQNIGEPSSSVIWGYNQDVPIAQISNATINQVAYTSFETNDQRYWSFTPAGRDSSDLAKTGKIRYQLNTGAVKTTGLLPAGTYILSLWTQGTKPAISGTTADVAMVNGESDNHLWSFYMDRVTVAAGAQITLTGSGLIDELRLYPQGAHMSTLTVIPQIGTSSVCSPDDKVNTYEYDALLRNKTVRDDQYNILKKYDYANVPQVPCTIAPDVWIGINPICFTDQSGSLPDINSYSTSATNSYGNLICNFTRTAAEASYLAKLNYTISFIDNTTYSNSILIKTGDLNTLMSPPLTGRSPESVSGIGIDTVINLSNDYGATYQRYPSRKRVRDNFTETNTLSGGLGYYIAPIRNSSGCTLLFSNREQTTFSKNDCTIGTGSYVEYTVPANSFTASSQFSADSLARASGQTYANAHGTCAADTSWAGINPSCTTSTADPGTPSLSAYSVNMNYISQISMVSATIIRTPGEAVHDATISYQLKFNDGSTAAYTTPMYKNQQTITISPPLVGYAPNSLASISITGVAYSGLKRLTYTNRQRLLDGVADGYQEANTTGTNYLAPIESPAACGTWYYNTPQTNFYRNNCSGGISGLPMSYTVAAHTDSSMLSQSYADALARARGQAYANQSGSCYIGQSVVTTYAGNGQQGYLDGTSFNSEFNYPQYEAMDGSGNLYVTDGPDMNSLMIKKITPGGTVTTLAGSTQAGFMNGVGAAAQFGDISGITVDAAGNVYASDGNNWMIRKITPNGVVSTLAGAVPRNYGYADGQGTAARFFYMSDITSDASGNLFVIDGSRIRRVTPGGLVSTFAGNGTIGYLDGPVNSAEFQFDISGHITIDKSGIIYIYDSGRIRKITGGIVSTLAGDGSHDFNDGTGASAKLGWIGQITTDAAGNILCADYENNCIRKITPAGVVSTITRNSNQGGNYGYINGILPNALFNVIEGIVTDSAGNIYVTDGLNYVVRKITPPY